MSSYQQKALIIPTKQGQFVVGTVSYFRHSHHQLLVRIVRMLALTQLDWQMQLAFPSKKLDIPCIGRRHVWHVEEVGEACPILRRRQQCKLTLASSAIGKFER